MGDGTMELKIKAFGVTKDILGKREIVIDLQGQTVAELRGKLTHDYPALSKLRSLMIAVNNNYAEDNLALQHTDEVALIPPVSGG